MEPKNEITFIGADFCDTCCGDITGEVTFLKSKSGKIKILDNKITPNPKGKDPCKCTHREPKPTLKKL